MPKFSESPRIQQKMERFHRIRKAMRLEHDNTPSNYATLLSNYDFQYKFDDGPNDVWVDRLYGEVSVFVDGQNWSIYDNPDGAGDPMAQGTNYALLEDALEEEVGY